MNHRSSCLQIVLVLLALATRSVAAQGQEWRYRALVDSMSDDTRYVFLLPPVNPVADSLADGSFILSCEANKQWNFMFAARDTMGTGPGRESVFDTTLTVIVRFDAEPPETLSRRGGTAGGYVGFNALAAQTPPRRTQRLATELLGSQRLRLNVRADYRTFPVFEYHIPPESAEFVRSRISRQCAL